MTEWVFSVCLSSGVDSPRRNGYPLQGNTNVAEAGNSIRGNFAKATFVDI